MESNLQVFIEMGDTERLSYRLLNEQDFDFYNKIYSEKEVMLYTYADAFDSIEEAKTAFKRTLVKQYADEEGTMFVVKDKQTGEQIGIVDYVIELLHQNGGVYEIGYFILPKYWGHGYANEMSEAMIGYLFDNYNIHKISASCHGDNKATESILKQLGMSKEGVIRKARYKNRQWVDEIRYGLLKEEWEEN